MATNPPSASSQQPAPPLSGAAAASSKLARFIVVFGTKGGVGKTVVAANAAVGLAQRTKKPVCLVDLDILAAGDVAKVLNVNPTHSIADLMPILKKHQHLPGANGGPVEGLSLENVVAPHASGVHVLTCVTNSRQLGQIDPKLLPLLFQELKKRYDYVIVDGGKSFSEALVAAFDASNLILLVATPDIIALYQTKWALGLVESLLFPTMMVKVVLNRAESRGGVGRQDVRAVIPCEVIAEIPSDGRTVGTSMNQGVPIVTAFGYTKVAEAFVKLAEDLSTRNNLYIAHQDIARHQRPDDSGIPGAEWSSRLYPAAADEPVQQEEMVDEIVLMKQRIHDRLVDELDLKRMDLGSMGNNEQMLELRSKTERIVANLLAREMGGLVSSPEVRARLVKEIADEALGFGPLEELLEDPQITDILVNNKDQIYVERRGKLILTSKKFISNDQVRAIIERIVAPIGRRIDESQPMVDARLPDGSRVNAIIPPLSLKGPVLSIRKFSKVRYSLDDFIRLGTLSPNMAQFLQACVLARRNMVISGGTGSGKTTLLNIVSDFVPEWERIITIEDAAELQLGQTHIVSLESRPPSIEGKGQIGIRDLFRNALRMRPDRIIIGECRGAESLDMLQAMNTGHDGSITTIHANSPRDIISRLDSMVLMSNVELPVRAIREMVASAIHVVVHTARMTDGGRKITAISEMTGLAPDLEVQFQDLFIFKQTGLTAEGAVMGNFCATGNKPSFNEDLEVKGIHLDPMIYQTSQAAQVRPADNG